MNADGSIIIETNIDNKDAEKELNRLSRQINNLEQKLSEKQGKQNAIKAELDDAMASALQTTYQVEKLNRELEQVKNVTTGQVGADPTQYLAQLQRQDQITAELKEQEAILRQQDKEAQRLGTQYAKITDQVSQQSAELNKAKERVGDIQKQLAASSGPAEMMASAMERVQESTGKFSMRLREVMRSALVFTVISQGLAALRGWLGDVIMANDEASAAISRLLGALLTLAQPLVDIIIPAFTLFVNVLTRVISTLAQLFAMLTGTTIENTKKSAQALNQQTQALEGTGEAAQEAEKSLASFDQINQISTTPNAGGGVAGAAADDGLSPSFDFETNLNDGQLQNILGLVTAIGTAFLTWKISKALGMNLQQTLGLALAIYSAIQFVKSVFDAWTNGVNWDNLLGMLLSATGLITGLGIAFGPVGAGIGALVTGLTMLVTGFQDAFKNGWNLQNLLLSIAGIFTAGIGIAVLTGSWIPLLIAAIASVLLAFTTFTGHGEELLAGLQTVLDGFLQFFTGIFSGDITTAIEGVGKIFDGLKTIAGAVFDGIRDTINSFFEWLIGKSDEDVGAILAWIQENLIIFVDWLETYFGGFLDALEEIFTGIITFLAGVFTNDWDSAWDGLVQIGKGALNLLINGIEAFVNFWINGLNSLIRALNTISFTVPDWVPELGGRTYGVNIPEVPNISIPRLARGAVIPPNREFLAVLGDQRSGYNYEVPDDKLRQLIREETAGLREAKEIRLVVTAGDSLVRELKIRLDRESQRQGVSLVKGGVL